MKKKYEKKDEVKKDDEPKVSEPKVVEKKKEEGPNLKDLEKQRNEAICEIRAKLLTKSRIRQGGSDAAAVRVREEANWNPVITQINEIGKILGSRIVTLDDLRKE